MNEELFAFTVRVKNIRRAHVYAFLSVCPSIGDLISSSYSIYAAKNVGILKIPTCCFFKKKNYSVVKKMYRKLEFDSLTPQ